MSNLLFGWGGLSIVLNDFLELRTCFPVRHFVEEVHCLSEKNALFKCGGVLMLVHAATSFHVGLR